jgi:hypothetical protein
VWYMQKNVKALAHWACAAQAGGFPAEHMSLLPADSVWTPIRFCKVHDGSGCPVIPVSVRLHGDTCILWVERVCNLPYMFYLNADCRSQRAAQ